MTTTRTIVDATGTKINLSWKALQRQFFIASLTTKYNVTVRRLQALYKRLDKQYGNTLTEEEKEFVRYMYHVEEFQAGLDGDRPNEPEDNYESEDNDYDD